MVTPFTAQTPFKLHGIFPLPGDVVASFLFQNLAGPSYDANYSATNADIFPSLGRNLAGGVHPARSAADALRGSRFASISV